MGEASDYRAFRLLLICALLLLGVVVRNANAYAPPCNAGDCDYVWNAYAPPNDFCVANGANDPFYSCKKCSNGAFVDKAFQSSCGAGTVCCGSPIDCVSAAANCGACGYDCSAHKPAPVQGGTCYYGAPACSAGSCSWSQSAWNSGAQQSSFTSGGKCYWGCSAVCGLSGWQYNLPAMCNNNAPLDDSNQCTTDTCSDSGVVHTSVAPGTLCAGGKCNTGSPSACCALSLPRQSCITPNFLCNLNVNAGSCYVWDSTQSNYACFSDGATNPSNSCTYCDAFLGPGNTGQGQWTNKVAGTGCPGGSCDGSGTCVLCSGCFIGGTCYNSGQARPGNSCQYCNTGTPNSWSTRANGFACASDGNVCTNDVCSTGSCTHPNLGAGTACTSDGLSCTSDVCDGAGGCGHILNAGSCLIAGACYANGALNPVNSCESCDTTVSTSSWTTLPAQTVCAPTSKCDNVGTCVNCDQDGDGYIRMDRPVACGVGNDCNDLNAAVHPGVVESGATCADGIDNNCNGEVDYDGFTNMAVPLNASGLYPKGDATCPVGVNTITMPSVVALNKKFYVDCTENVGSVRSIDVTGSPAAGVTCDTSNVLWTGNKLSVNCTTSVLAGSITCGVNTGKSYGIPPPKTVSFTSNCGIGNCAINCDNDNDGYNASYGGICDTTKGTDCNDNNAAINPGVMENGALCADNIDNNCNGQADYDGGTTGLHGDVFCPVAVTALSTVDPSCSGASGAVAVNCTYSVTGVNSTLASISQGGVERNCTFQNWTGNVAQFNCSSSGFAAGNAVIRCTVNTSLQPRGSYQTPPDLTQTIQLHGTGGTCGNACLCSSTGACSCSATWLGNVTDIRSGQRVGIAASVRVDNSANIAAPQGAINVPGVPLGLHNITASAAGYDPLTIFSVPFTTDPTYADITLAPVQCHSDCTYGGVCDFNCVNDPASGCKLNASLSLAQNGNITQICQYAVPGSYRQYNSTAYIQCCTGPLVDNELYQTKFALQSCSSQGITHKTAVMVNGRQLELTVVSYDKCEN